MPKAKNPKVDEAEALFLKGMKLIEIANKLELPEGTVRRWKSTYKWNNERSDKIVSARKKGGAPKGNKNAVGAGAPFRNKNAESHGFFSKWLPSETAEIMMSIKELDPLDILWDNIQLQYTAIIRAQKLMYVKDQKDKTVEKVEEKNGNICGERWEVQQAWDKQATFLNAQSRAMKTLESMVKQYDELLHKNWDMTTEEQRARIEHIKAGTARLQEKESESSQLVEDWIAGVTEE